MDDKLGDIIEALSELCDDNTIPKNIKLRLEKMVLILKEDVDSNVKVNKVLHELDEITDDANIQTYTRTQLYNIGSLLEKI